MKTKTYAPVSYRRPNWLQRFFVSAGLLTAAAMLVNDALAADVTWSGGTAGTGVAWLGTTNWSTSAVPGSTDNAIFASINALPTSITLDMSANGGIQQVGSITLSPNLTTPNFSLKDASSSISGVLVLNGANGILLSNASVNSELIIETNIQGTPGGNQGISILLGSSGIMYACGQLANYTADPGRIEIYNSIGETNGSHGITLTGPGNVYIRNVNTYSGSTVVSNGALEFDALGTAGNGVGPIYLSGGDIQCGATRNGYTAGQAFIPNPIVITSNAYIFNLASTSNSTRYIPFSGPLSGTTGSLIICNPTVTNDNTFCARFAGGFTFNLPLVIGDTSGDALSDNTLDFSAVDLCNSNGYSQTWNGVISGPGSLRRDSPTQANSVLAGAAILTGNNTYSGGTLMYRGTIFANNTAGSALGSGSVTVTNLAVLAGNGSVVAPTTIYRGGTIQPGATSSNIANLNVSSLTFNPGANYVWQIGSATGTAGSAWDLITCSSGWTDAGATTNVSTVFVTSAGIIPTNWNDANSYSWMIIANNGNATGFNVTNWTVNATAFSAPVAGVFGLTNDLNGDLILTYTPTSGSYLINVPSGSVAQGAVSPTPYPLLSGLYNVTKTGNGEVILTNSLNSYQGATFIDAGTVSAAVNSAPSGGAFGASSSPLMLGYTNGASNATLNIDQPGVTIANAITVQAGSTGLLTISNSLTSGLATYSGSVTLLTNVMLSAPTTSTDLFSGNFSGAGGINLAGGGTIVLSGIGSYAGPTTVSNLSLDLNASALGTNLFTINNGVAVDNTGSSTVTLAASPMIWNSSFTFNGTTNLNFGTGIATMTTNCTLTVNSNVLGIEGPIAGTGFSLTKAGPGELSLTAATNSTYTGGTTNLAGILGINATATFGNGTGPLVLAGGVLRNTASRGTLALANPVQMTVSTRFTGDSTSTPPSTRALPFSGVFTVTPGATMLVDNTGLASNTFVVQFQGSNYTTINWPIQLGDVNYDTAGSLTGINLYNDNTTPTQTISSLITGSGLVQRNAASLNSGGTTILTAQNTFSGGFELYSGAIGFGASSVSSGGSVISGPLGTGTLTIGADNAEASLTIFPYGGARTIDNHIVLNGIPNTIITGSNNLTLTAPFNTGGVAKTLTVLNTGITTISGPITNAGASAGGALTKAGIGTLVFTGVNTYPGTTTVNAGTLLINGNSSALTNTFTVNGGNFGGSGIVGGPVTYASGAEAYLYKSNVLVDSPLNLETNLTLNGNTVIVDLGGTTTLGAGTYNLLTYAGTLTGSFAATPVFVNGSLAGGYAGTISTATPGVVTLVVAAAAVPLSISQETVNGSVLQLSGTGGTAGATYHIVTSTNILLALTNWVPLTTNTFAANGGFTNNLTINPSQPARFYRLKTP